MDNARQAHVHNNSNIDLDPAQRAELSSRYYALQQELEKVFTEELRIKHQLEKKIYPQLQDAMSSLREENRHLDELENNLRNRSATSEEYADFIEQCKTMKKNQKVASELYKRCEMQLIKFHHTQENRYNIQTECDQLGWSLYEQGIIQTIIRTGTPPLYDAYSHSPLPTAYNTPASSASSVEAYIRQTPPATPKPDNIPTSEDLSNACKDLSDAYKELHMIYQQGSQPRIAPKPSGP